ncbi:MAG: hypothetical protein AAFN78_11070 [Pseudomonadota bacterium]
MSARHFIEGLLAGAVVTGAAIAAPALWPSGVASQLPAWDATLDPAMVWALDNLGYSIPVFALVLVLFGVSLARLREMLAQDRPVADVAHAEYLTDTWVSLFFGVGVIWTAIGMRGALIHALGDPDATLAGGAFAVLQKMVDGGILLALSTTIFGGVGGYLLRVVKTVAVGPDLKRCYEQAASAPARSIESSLKSIEARLERLTPQPAGAEQ